MTINKLLVSFNASLQPRAAAEPCEASTIGTAGNVAVASRAGGRRGARHLGTKKDPRPGEPGVIHRTAVRGRGKPPDGMPSNERDFVRFPSARSRSSRTDCAPSVASFRFKGHSIIDLPVFLDFKARSWTGRKPAVRNWDTGRIRLSTGNHTNSQAAAMRWPPSKVCHRTRDRGESQGTGGGLGWRDTVAAMMIRCPVTGRAIATGIEN